MRVPQITPVSPSVTETRPIGKRSDQPAAMKTGQPDLTRSLFPLRQRYRGGSNGGAHPGAPRG